jgi:hypothetical protein
MLLIQKLENKINYYKERTSRTGIRESRKMVLTKTLPNESKAKYHALTGLSVDEDQYLPVVFVPQGKNTAPAASKVAQSELMSTVHPSGKINKPLTSSIFVRFLNLLSDLQGKILLKGFSNQINIQNLKSGVYIIKINGIVKKVVKI